MTGPTVLAEPTYFDWFNGTARHLICDAYDTIANVQAGDDVTNALHDMTGFTVTANDLPITRAGTRWQGAYPGRKTPDDSALVFYADADPTNDIRSIVTEGQETNIVLYPAGMGSGKPQIAYHVLVKSISGPYGAMEDVPTITVGFSLLEAPVFGTYPAS